MNFGKVLPITEIHFENELLEFIWGTYKILRPVRRLIEKEAESHNEAMQFLNNFTNHTGPLTITVFSKTYQVITDEQPKKVKSNEFKQRFSIYDQEQLITNGDFRYYFREPKEVVGIAINNKGQIYSNIRDMANKEKHRWYNKKSFYNRGESNENNENQTYQERQLQS